MPPSLSFHPLTRADFPRLAQWLSAPHVAPWWREPSDRASVEAKYAPRAEGDDPTHVFVIQLDARPVGWIQWYRWSDYLEHARQLGAEPSSAGIDLAIGEAEMTGHGVGPAAIGQFLRQTVFSEPDISAVVTDPEENNLRSLRAFEKTGFRVIGTVQIPGEPYRRRVLRLDAPLNRTNQILVLSCQ